MPMFTLFDNMSDRSKGFLLIALGAILLLFTFGFMRQLLNTVIIVTGFYLLGMGLYRLRVHTMVQKLINKKRKE